MPIHFYLLCRLLLSFISRRTKGQVDLHSLLAQTLPLFLYRRRHALCCHSTIQAWIQKTKVTFCYFHFGALWSQGFTSPYWHFSSAIVKAFIITSVCQHTIEYNRGAFGTRNYYSETKNGVAQEKYMKSSGKWKSCWPTFDQIWQSRPPPIHLERCGSCSWPLLVIYSFRVLF